MVEMNAFGEILFTLNCLFGAGGWGCDKEQRKGEGRKKLERPRVLEFGRGGESGVVISLGV